MTSTLKKHNYYRGVYGKIHDHKLIKKSKRTTLKFSFNLIFMNFFVLFFKFYWARNILIFKDMFGEKLLLMKIIKGFK